MIEFIQRLYSRYLNVLKAATIQDDRNTISHYSQILKQLALAETLLRKQPIRQQLPLNLVVFGPTQAGKSTLVNCLLPEPLAGVSPLAGFTIHPQAFYTGNNKADFSPLDSLFPGFEQQQQKQLQREVLEAYSITELNQSSPLGEGDLLVWDTPDFDSIDARGYIDGVLRTIGLADILILIVSKEKYADQSVWEMLSLLIPLQLPFLVCINKLSEGEEQTLFRSFQQRYEQQFSHAQLPKLISLPLIETDQPLDPSDLVSTVSEMISALDPNLSQHASQRFLQANWAHWLQAIHEENHLEAQWQADLEQNIKQQLVVYRQEYLDQPEHYDSFQRTLAELLELLELPGLGQALSQARNVITWPVRKLLSFGQSIISSDKADEVRDRDYEANLLRQLADQMITDLEQESFQQDDQEGIYNQAWEKGFRQTLNNSRTELLDQFEEQVAAYQNQFELTIQQAAEELHSRLQDQPVLLNSLRAARVTTDAAAVVLTLHAGGIGMSDFILAPAMLSLSSMLTESSLGHYINSVKARLKQQQYETVEALLVDHLQAELIKLRARSAQTGHFHISEEEIKEVENELSS